MSTTDTPSPGYHPSYASPDGDIILRSDDGVLFRVQSGVLIAGSGFFRGMLEIPRDNVEKENNEPIVMQETSGVLLIILEIINPMGDFPTIDSLDVAQQLVTAAEKLEVPKVITYVRRLIMRNPSFLESPLDLYILGCQNHWEEVARAASTGTLIYNLNASIHLEKLKKLNTDDLLKLQSFHCRRKRAMIDALHPYTGSPPVINWDNMLTGHPRGGHNHSPENYLCGPWKQLKLDISEAMESQPRGNWLRPRSFIEQPELQGLWVHRCLRDRCPSHSYFGKNEVHAELIRILDLLPSSI
ncbi:hypothetical protein BD410DRAFT_836397 [Rickenella mellea]|uniref:BTB domain-containing protein n=1 Tax=Rickenella mellea TaxID=50990 RepID=A0A4Y7QGQ1_9AGAM|nr:hypothetical protein BD410DRAFT_836397 [Rickenella mellea]